MPKAKSGRRAAKRSNARASAIAPAVKVPSSISEYRRLGHAFLAGSAFKKGDTVYVVASTIEPLRRIIGVFATLEEADAARRGRTPCDITPSAAELRSAEIYSVTVPDVDDESEIAPGPHGYTDLALKSDRRLRKRRLSDVASVEVCIHLKNGETVVVKPLVVPDAIFISRGAYELFAFPAYQAAFGPEYVRALRKQLFG